MLLAVLIVVVIGALMGTIALDRADSAVTSARLSLHRRTTRAIALSGVMGVMAELETQRRDLLGGGDPDLTAEWTLFQDGSLEGRVRLEPVADESEAVAESEAGKLDLNAASPEMLARLAGLGAERASAVAGRRARGGFTSVHDLHFAGVDPSDAAGVLGGVSLERLATAGTYDPEIAAGAGEGLDAGDTRARWDATAREFVDARRVGRETVDLIGRLAATGSKLESPEAVCAALISTGEPARRWGEALDALAFTDEGVRPGLIDLNRAPEAVLACVPGLENAAPDIVAARERLATERRASIAWPLDSGLVTADEMAKAAPWLTTRTLQWRVRVVGELVRASERSAEPALVDQIVFDAVIDVSGEHARIAYLRDVTFEAAAADMATLAAEGLGDMAIDDGGATNDAPEVERAPEVGDDGGRAGAVADSSSVGDPAVGAFRRGRWTAGGRR